MSAQRITADDVLAPGSPWRDCEVWNGIALVREPTGGRAEEVASRIVAPLAMHVRARDLGWVFLSSQGFLLARNPDLLLAPDGAYLSRRRLPALPATGFVPVAPDFALEVRSPRDTWEATVEKCGLWIAHGTAVAWAVDPEAKRVAVFRADGSGVVHDRTGSASAAPVLPDFAVSLADLFQGL